MTTKLPSSCMCAVSSFSKHQLIGFRTASFHQRVRKPIGQTPTRIASIRWSRYYASKPELSQEEIDRPEKAALVEIEGYKQSHPVNPPRSTNPPPLKLPEQGNDNVAVYYFRIGRSYGKFYWAGIKAVWFNYRAAKALRERMKQDSGVGGGKMSKGKELSIVTRSEFQLLARNSYDIGKLPFFGVLVAVFGEWLPLIVPFIPGAVPGTCRIPKQIQGMRLKAEERRRVSFRQGVSGPDDEEIKRWGLHQSAAAEWPLAERQYGGQMALQMRKDQLMHLSCTLNLHNRLWDRVAIPPPVVLLRRSIAKHLAYVTSDDFLLHRHRGVSKLSSEEVMIACEERGLDVLGKREDALRSTLEYWVERQKKDRGQGYSIMKMLFIRPNNWQEADRPSNQQSREKNL